MSSNIMEIVDVRITKVQATPLQLVVDVVGKVSSSGWSNPTLAPRYYIGGTPPDGVQDFDFVADAPTGIVIWVIKPIRASLVIDGGLPPSYKGVRVHSATNSIEMLLSDGGELRF